MVSIKGTFNNGVVHPLEAIAAKEGQQVIITFVEQENPSEDLEGSDWEELNQILADCQVDTGITAVRLISPQRHKGHKEISCVNDYNTGFL